MQRDAVALYGAPASAGLAATTVRNLCPQRIFLMAGRAAYSSAQTSVSPSCWPVLHGTCFAALHFSEVGTAAERAATVLPPCLHCQSFCSSLEHGRAALIFLVSAMWRLLQLTCRGSRLCIPWCCEGFCTSLEQERAAKDSSLP